MFSVEKREDFEKWITHTRIKALKEENPAPASNSMTARPYLQK
jgi:hypothetical protein